MKIRTNREGGILIVSAEGRVDGANAREFDDALQAAISESDSALIMDLEALSYISSAGLRVLLLVAKKFQKRDGKLVVCSLSSSIKEVFEISGFDQIIPLHASRSEALVSLGG